jgi:hypothetical protein
MTVKAKLLLCDVSFLLLWVLLISTVMMNVRCELLIPVVPGYVAVRCIVLGTFGFKNPYGRVSRYPFLAMVVLLIGTIAAFIILEIDPRYDSSPSWLRALVIIMFFCGLLATCAGLYEDMKFSVSKSQGT